MGFNVSVLSWQQSRTDSLGYSGSRLTASGPESQTIKRGVNTPGQVRLKPAMLTFQSMGLWSTNKASLLGRQHTDIISIAAQNPTGPLAERNVTLCTLLAYLTISFLSYPGFVILPRFKKCWGQESPQHIPYHSHRPETKFKVCIMF